MTSPDQNDLNLKLINGISTIMTDVIQAQKRMMEEMAELKQLIINLDKSSKPSSSGSGGERLVTMDEMLRAQSSMRMELQQILDCMVEADKKKDQVSESDLQASFREWFASNFQRVVCNQLAESETKNVSESGLQAVKIREYNSVGCQTVVTRRAERLKEFRSVGCQTVEVSVQRQQIFPFPLMIAGPSTRKRPRQSVITTKKKKKEKKVKVPTKTVDLPPLTAPLSHILSTIEHKEFYKEPYQITTRYTKRNENKYCSYHKQNGHDTEVCYKAKEFILELISAGHLDHFVLKVDRKGKGIAL